MKHVILEPFNPQATFEKRWLAERYLESYGAKLMPVIKGVHGRYRLNDSVYTVAYDANIFAWFILREVKETRKKGRYK